MDKWLNHPTALKIMALGIGILMWAVVHWDSNGSNGQVASLIETKKITAIVQPVGLDDGNYILHSLEPKTVTLTVGGTRNDLNRAKSEDFTVEVDLRGVGAGEHMLALTAPDLPRGIDLTSIAPSQAKVVIEALATKEFEVEIETQGNPAQGYKAGTPIVKPSNRAHVTLPENTLAKVAKVAGVISVDGKSATIPSQSVKLSAYDASGNVIEGATIDPAVVEVELPITNPFKTVPLQYRLIGQMPAGLSIASFSPEVEQATVYGPQSALDGIDFIEVDVQLSQLTKSGKYTIPLQATGQVTEISPAEVSVNVEVVLSETRTLEGLNIQWNGLGEGLTSTLTDPPDGKVDIVVKGAPSMLDRLQPGDVQIIADLSGKGPGTHTIQLIVNLPRFTEQAGGTRTVTVEIAEEVPASVEPSDPGGGTGDGDGGDGDGGGSGGGGAGGSPSPTPTPPPSATPTPTPTPSPSDEPGEQAA